MDGEHFNVNKSERMRECGREVERELEKVREHECGQEREREREKGESEDERRYEWGI